ncbi:MAG: HD domain-containing phosphohydrolase [Actinomycetota bacterium]
MTTLSGPPRRARAPRRALPRVLAVDDEPLLLAAIVPALRSVAEVHTALGGRAGLELLAQAGPFAVVISDMRMPKMDGVEFLTRAREMEPDAVRIMLTGQTDQDSAVAAINSGGVFRFLVKPCPTPVLRATVAEALEEHERIRDHRGQARRAIAASVRALARAVDAKDPSTNLHSERVANVAEQIAVALGWSPEATADVRDAGLVHDVGKIGIPDHILLKASRLTPEEFERVKTHAPVGALIVSEFMTEAQVSWVRGHHERHDGAGYPDGLVGDDVPEGARILALADAWDVMRTGRPYAEALSVQQALGECIGHAGRQFCPVTVEALVSVVRRGRLDPPHTEPGAP